MDLLTKESELQSKMIENEGKYIPEMVIKNRVTKGRNNARLVR